MSDLAVAAVGDDRRLEQRRRLGVGEARQEAIEPDEEGLARQQAAQAFGLDQRRREKVVAARLAPGGAIGVDAVPAQRRIVEPSGQRRV